MVDDIEDSSTLRRGIPVAHSIFGVPSVINGANYAYFLALEKCHAWKNPEAMNVSLFGIKSFVSCFRLFIFDLIHFHPGVCWGTFKFA